MAVMHHQDQLGVVGLWKQKTNLLQIMFQCIGKIFCEEFQRYPMKFHPKHLTHAKKDVHS